MEDLIYIQSSLEVSTSDLKSDTLQVILIRIKKINIDIGLSREQDVLCNKILSCLWSHLQTQLNEFEDQLLCSTCFYTILSIIEKQDTILQLILQNITEELNQYNKRNEKCTTRTTVSIIYGMFQSNFLNKIINFYHDILKDILNFALCLLIKMGYEYSHYTLIVFKILVSYRKLFETELKNAVFTKNNQIKLLNLVNHNWENPIHGIRNLNKTIFQNILLIFDNDIYEQVLKEIDSFYWNKAKYLMLSDIIDQYKGNLYIILKRYNLVEGLLHSLHKPGLVSAGADMYFSLLKKINSEEEWSNIFLYKIKQTLYSSSQKSTENFNNYWCIATLKKFPSVGFLLLKTLEKCSDSEQKLFSMLCVLKQCNKLNLIEKHWMDGQLLSIKKMILCGIQHCNPYIRMIAFDIVCISNSRAWPSQLEYELILTYLSDNVSSDCTVLRLNLLNSFCNFLSHLQTLHIRNTNDAECEDYFLLFCEKLQIFIMKSLNFEGNYQRKITTVKIVSTVFHCYTAIPKKKQKQIKQNNTLLIQYIIDNGHWILFDEKVINKLISLLSDPADDVRENVLQLLLNYYEVQLRQPVIVNKLTESALLKLKSKFFYDINCGQSMFELIINLLSKQCFVESVKFKNVDEIFRFAYNELVSEYNLKRNIIESIEQGSQLHSNIRILHAVIEISLKTSYDLQINNEILSLLEILEGISNQFVWEQEISTSSDFSKMSDMLQKIIENSGHTSNNEDYEKVSGLQQIVLNCLWLNVKTACELAALLIKLHNSDRYLSICNKSLKIITKVLETSRHKGAIEAAGVALGEGIRYLTSLPAKSELADLPSALLKQKLKEWILEANNMASITRRGAGLSIMVHRIVSNDMQRKKTLFHYFINTLINTCNLINDDSSNFTHLPNKDNEKDLPKAIYIHFLTRIVTDSGLTTEVMYYSAEIAKLAFDNLTSKQWQIRNAALQLYGALVPKFIGQKKSSGSEDEVTATVACDEFRTHFPLLWMFIQDQLKQNREDILQYHSNLIPILNILGNLAKRYNFLYDLKHRSIADNDLLKSLAFLLQSSLYMVRRLTAKCIFNMYSFDDIFTLLINVKLTNENLLHGCLFLLANCRTYYKDVIYQKMFDVLTNKFSTILQRNNHSYLCKELMVIVSMDKFSKNYDIHKVLLETRNTNEPGLFQWASTHICKYLMICSWNDIPQCLKLILDSSDCEKYCEVIYTRLNSESYVDYLILRDINNILLSFPKNVFSCGIWKILYRISILINIDFDQYVHIKDLIEYLYNNGISYKLRYIIPFVARVATDETVILFISKIIHKLCNSEVYDVDMRMISAIANNEIAFKIGELSDVIKINCIITAVILLQDEDEDVRNLCVNFYGNINKKSLVFHPYICLRSILDAKFLCSVLSDPTDSINTICKDLSELFSSINSGSLDSFNPFVNESKNIYQEVDVVLQLIDKIKDDSIIKTM